MISADVADGIDLITHAHVNTYLIDDDTGVTLVDAGLPRMWPMVVEALHARGRTPADVQGLVLTHGHFDHVGFAARIQREWGTPIFVHAADKELAAHPYRYRPQSNRFLYPLAHPRSVPIIARMGLAGALNVKGVTEVGLWSGSEPLELPGRPIPLHTPGHTDGHCGLHLPDRDTLITGDALVTLDPYTGKKGPQIVASAATADTSVAMASLDTFLGTDAQVALPGHGEPWTGGIAEAVDRAHAVGEH